MTDYELKFYEAGILDAKETKGIILASRSDRYAQLCRSPASRTNDERGSSLLAYDAGVAFELNCQSILSSGISHRYMLLDRMRVDCNYFLGPGNRHEKYLWAGNVREHIAYMKAIWNGFKADEKPEWLSLEDIQDYEKKMTAERAPLDKQIRSASSRASDGMPAPSGKDPSRKTNRSIKAGGAFK